MTFPAGFGLGVSSYANTLFTFKVIKHKNINAWNCIRFRVDADEITTNIDLIIIVDIDLPSLVSSLFNDYKCAIHPFFSSIYYL